VVVLVYLLIAFKIWMLLDAIRRRIQVLWFLVVLIPFGDIVYFFAIKARDFQARSVPSPQADARQSALISMENAVQETPSFLNRVRLGWALLEGGHPKRASGFFEQAERTHRGDKEALFGLGLSQLEGGESEAAVATLTPLIDRCLDYEQFAAALALAEALYRSGRKQGTITLLREVSERSGRLEHRLVLARYQLRGDDKAEARDTLQAALGEFDHQPEPVRMRNGAAATEARRLLRLLEHQLSQQLPSRSA
jgi:hypothetical protein